MRRLNDARAALLAEVTGGQVLPKGRLRVAAPTDFGARYVAPVLTKMSEAHPELSVDLRLGSRFADLLAEGIDVAIRIGKLADCTLKARRIVGLGMGPAVYFFTGDRSSSHAGPKYASGDITWHSVDPTWSTMWGEYALDMVVSPVRVRGASDGTFEITGTLLRSLCGSVLTKLPDPPDGVTRQELYRLGFGFYNAEDNTPTDVFPVPVQDGACVVRDNQVVFDWSYPSPLTGWSPVRYERPSKEKLVVFYGIRGETQVPYDQLDLRLACEALLVESTDKMREVFSEVTELEIRAVKGVVSPVIWAGVYSWQRFQTVNGSCLAPAEIIDG